MPSTGEPARVRVIVPTYRRPELLARLVKALEAQTLPAAHFEVAIVDDGSGDATASVLAELASQTSIQLHPISSPRNAGPAAARNVGWLTAATPFLAFVDDDCVPEPGWLAGGLAALEGDPGVGVAQGVTRRPTGPTTDWTVFREVLQPTPWFEGCNLFFRREAVEHAGGFDERLSSGGEDTMLGWAVLAAGWRRAFASDAVVWHDNEERGLGYHLRYGWREGRICTVARRYPPFRAALWRPWAVRPRNVAYLAALTGGVLGLGLRRPAFLVLALPYAWMRRPPAGHPRFVRLAAERVAVDTAVFAGMTAGAIRERQLIV